MGNRNSYRKKINDDVQSLNKVLWYLFNLIYALVISTKAISTVGLKLITLIPLALIHAFIQVETSKCLKCLKLR